MRQSDQLASFVGEALANGRGRDEIADALRSAGWSDSEVRDALNAWGETPFTPPVPRPRAYVSARESFIYGLMFIALVLTAWHILSLAFNVIDMAFPEATSSSWDRSDSVRWSVSVLVVFFPLFLFLNRRVERAASADPATRRSSVRRSFGYVTLFIASLSLLGDLISVIYTFLSGDLTVRFVLKALSVAVVALVILFHFRQQLAEKPDET